MPVRTLPYIRAARTNCSREQERTYWKTYSEDVEFDNCFQSFSSKTSRIRFKISFFWRKSYSIQRFEMLTPSKTQQTYRRMLKTLFNLFISVLGIRVANSDELAKLKSAFVKPHGTITAANSFLARRFYSSSVSFIAVLFILTKIR